MCDPDDVPLDDDEDLEPDPEVLAAEERAAHVADGLAAFLTLVGVAPADRGPAALAAIAVLHAVADARGPDDPTPGMLSVPVLIEDPLARVRLADAAPGARETLGELEVALVGRTPDECTAMARRLRDAIRRADAQLAV